MSKFDAEIAKRDLSKEFDLLYDITYSHKHQMRMNNDPAVYNLNRYTDIIPYDDTRVVLHDKWVTVENQAIDSYINADYVNSVMGQNDRKIIATQGPKEITMGHFWRMVLQENVKLIICVCRLYEKGNIKCDKYWPEGDSRKEKDFQEHLGVDGLVILKTTEKSLCDTVVERQFEILTPDGGRHYVRQLHYLGWPDHGVPDGEDFEMVLHELIGFLLNNTLTPDKVIVHCSAGIGRTGTTIALSELLISISS